MLNNIGFFTPVQYKRPTTFFQHLLNQLENHFYLGHKVAHIATPNNRLYKVVVKDVNQCGLAHYILCAFKLVSYCAPFFSHVVTRVFKADLQLGRYADIIAKYSFRIQAAMFICKIAFRYFYTIEVLPSISVPALMDRFEENLNYKSFDVKTFQDRLEIHINTFNKRGINNQNHFGYIEKFDLDASTKPQIYIRADLHGDLESLMKNLTALQEEKLLDENFKCRPGVHLMFLGDYCDRGNHGVQILELLMQLREENPDQVHLIRGNHEDVEVNKVYGDSDPSLMEIMKDPNARQTLQRFYETMSLTTYLSLKTQEREQREYIQCTHGLFEPAMDPAPLLDTNEAYGYLAVPKTRSLSSRVHSIAQGSSGAAQSAKRVRDLAVNFRYFLCLESIYNWGDVEPSGQSILGYHGNRNYKLNAEDINHYFKVSSQNHRVRMLFRGHEHQFQHILHEGNVIVTTLPVGAEIPYYAKNIKDHQDLAYIITPALQVQGWTKRAITRKPAEEKCSISQDSVPLTSSEV